MPSILGVAGFNWVDLILILLAVVAAVRGLRLGAAVQVLSYGGFWVGLLLGAVLAPLVVVHVRGQVGRAAVSLLVVFGVAILLGGIGRAIGGRLWGLLHRIHLGLADAGLGLAVGVVATLVAAWLAATILVQGPSQALATGISNSRILRAMDGVLPPAPKVFGRIRNFVNTSGLPQVFAGINPAAGGPVRVASVPAVRQAVAAAQASTVEVRGQGCGNILEGSGFVVAPDVVVTNAHVVAGVAHPMVVDQQGGQHPAAAIFYDPNFDLAVLRTTGLAAPSLHLDPNEVARGTQAAVLGFPQGGPFTAVPAGVINAFTATGPNIYDQGWTHRTVYALQAIVRPGNSGGPLVEPDGQVVGIVFSKSVSNPDLGYALASPGVVARVDRALAHPGNPGTGACASQ